MAIYRRKISFMTLGNFTNIQSGRMFRTAIKSSSKGEFRVVQVRDVLIKNGKATIDWDALARVDIETNRVVSCLKNGQLLMTVKGEDKQVIRVENVPDNIVCTQHFLIIEPSENVDLDIEFVEFVLTSDISKKWLANRAGGSYQSVISKTTLEQLPFPNVPRSTQIKAIALNNSLEKEQLLLQTLFDEQLKQKNKLVSIWLRSGDLGNG